MTLRERIKLLCKEQKTSLNAMESECGFAKGYASKLDKSTPNAENLRKIANFFNVSVDYLLGVSDIRYAFKTSFTRDERGSAFGRENKKRHRTVRCIEEILRAVRCQKEARC